MVDECEPALVNVGWILSAASFEGRLVSFGVYTILFVQANVQDTASRSERESREEMDCRRRVRSGSGSRFTRHYRFEMKNFVLSAGILLSAVILYGCGIDGENDERDDQALFERVESSSSNITFKNELSEAPKPHRTEILYEYFINGAGVAVADVNGDGRDDLYFNGNMKYNQLYINRGDLTFEEASEEAGVRGRRNTWNTGVSIVDVNGDGLRDIYVCYSGNLPLERRVDELYINQGPDENGIPRFVEKAGEYGLAQPHSSNQAYFFDYDRDGDLDLFLQTHNVETLPRGSRQSIQKKLAEEDSVNGNRFYENRGGSFVDVTAEVGIQSSPLTYGLGAGIADVNKDGWPDIYVGNDYSPPDYLYINNGDGTFTNSIDEWMSHTSRSSMGVDISDINNDGLSDIVVLDMIGESNYRQKMLYTPNDRGVFNSLVESGFGYQYTINTLHINNGNRTFSEVSQLTGVSNTDWSWAPLIADYNNNGLKDLFITNGLVNDFANRDFIDYRVGYIEDRNYDLDLNDVSVIMDKLPQIDINNYMFENRGNLRFSDVSDEWGVGDPVNSNGAVYSDLDNDGDLEIVTNNINERAYVYENTARDAGDNGFLQLRLDGPDDNTDGIGAKVTVYSGQQRQYQEQFPTRGYLSSVSPVLHFGVDKYETVDSVRVVWPTGRVQVLREVESNQRLTISEEQASDPVDDPGSRGPLFQGGASPIDFRHRMDGKIDDFQRQPLMVNAKSYEGPALTTGDVNGDGREDLFVGGGEGQSSLLYLQQDDGTFRARKQPAFAADKASHDAEAIFFDFNDDGHLDLYVASGGYGWFAPDDEALQDRLYVNDGTGRFSRKPGALPRMRTSTGTVATADLRGNGHPDLFVGGRVVPGRYPESPRSYLLINDGDGGFADRTEEISPELRSPGMVTDAQWRDLNTDGQKELILVGEWMPIRVFGQDEQGLSEETGQYFSQEYSGLWNVVHVDDLTGDGRPEIVAGNLGRNTQINATPEAPAELYYDDYDGDGAVDPILSYSIDGTRYPHPFLDRLRQEVPSLGARFSSYSEYAEATIDDLFTGRERRESERLEAAHLETSLFLKRDDGTFERHELPIEAQFAPVFNVSVLDYDDDGDDDLVLSGNMNETRVRFAKYDANYGLLLEQTAPDRFESVPQHRSGFRVQGDVRGTARLGDTLLFGINRGEVAGYRVRSD